MSVLTLTLNPAIDKTIEVEVFELASLNKVKAVHKDPGGKGINVSKVVKALGGETMALGLCAGEGGTFIRSSLDQMGIPHDFLQVSGETRTNLKVLDCRTQDVTEVNELGPKISAQDLEHLSSRVEGYLKDSTLLVLSGSVPPGVSFDYYGQLILLAKKYGKPVFLDADGELFKQAVQFKPTFIKPNASELKRFFNKEFSCVEDYKDAIRYFLECGVENIFISLGEQGAYYGNKDSFYRLKPLAVDAHSTVGAGDAFVGACAYAISLGLGLEDMLVLAVATSAGAVTTLGTKAVSKAWVDEHLSKVVIEKGELT
jgi:1-phosphofructokinase